MPVLISTPPDNVLPVWDSFEATIFVCAGIIVGFVLGFLFPSIWRTLRRRFHSRKHFRIKDIPWHRSLESDLKILPIPENSSLPEYFVMARDFFQRGEPRHSVKLYGEILISEKTSTADIHRALFELAQVYFSLGLLSRAYDTALELLTRRQRDEHIFQFLLLVLHKYSDVNKLSKIFRLFKGLPNEILGKKMAHVACTHAEKIWATDQDVKKVVELSRLALRYDSTSTHAQFLLWKSSSQIVRNKGQLNISAKWIAFGVELDAWISLCERKFLSPHAGAGHFLTLMTELLTQDPNFEHFSGIRTEFKEIINIETISATKQKILLESIFSAILLLKDRQDLITEQNCLNFLNKICIDQQILKQIFPVDEMTELNALRLGTSVHFCPDCQSLFPRFNWSCDICQSPLELKAYVSLFTGYAFHVNTNWNPHTDNRDRRIDAHLNT